MLLTFDPLLPPLFTFHLSDNGEFAFRFFFYVFVSILALYFHLIFGRHQVQSTSQLSEHINSINHYLSHFFGKIFDRQKFMFSLSKGGNKLYILADHIQYEWHINDFKLKTEI